MSNGNLPFLLLSYKQLRLIPGLLGIALPIILVVWGFFLCECIDIQDSISDYYSLRTRDALVGILLAVGVFLFTYKGYEREKVPAFGQNHGPGGVPVRHWRGFFPQHRRRLRTNGAFHIRGRLVHHAGDILYVPFHQRQTGRAPYAQEEVTKQDLRGVRNSDCDMHSVDAGEWLFLGRHVPRRYQTSLLARISSLMGI